VTGAGLKLREIIEAREKIGTRQLKKLVSQTAIYTLLSLICFFFLFPLIWTFVTSLKTTQAAFAIPPKWFFLPQWSNYFKAWVAKGFASAFINTLIISVGSSFLSILLALPASYIFARHKFKGLATLGVSFIAIRLLPEMLFIIPLYIIYTWLNLYDTHLGLILVFQIFNLPFTVWVLKGFIEQVPREIEETAFIDGCSELGALARITLPLIAPGIAATAIIAFIVIWTNLLYPLSLAYSNAETAPLAIAKFKGYGAFDWPLMAAGSILITLPQLVFFIMIQRHLIKGLTMGALKG
jgi:multiple sugar transport system permease protein